MAHTPGPWRFVRYDGCFGPTREGVAMPVLTLGDDGACGDPDCCGAPSYHIEVSEEDAKLIAASPDLLAALRDVQSQCAGHADEFSQRVWVIADQAIAKAEGR